MRITYRTLAAAIERMTDDQKDSDVTFENIWENECHAVTLRICGDDHDSLDDGHPVLIDFKETEDGPVHRATVEELCEANEIK